MLKTFALTGLLFLAPAGGAQAATVFSEDFSGAGVGTHVLGTIGGTQFEVTSGDVDIIGPGFFSCVSGATKCLDLIGSAGQGTIKSNVGIDLIAGTTYTIAYADVLQGFAAGPTPSIDYTVSLGSHSFNLQSIPTTTLVSLSFTAAVTELGALLAFASTSNIDGSHGPVLSGISIDAVATTPIPAALPLFASALAGMGFVGWRRRRAQG
ncbi:hypothetical protein [Dongia sp.]|uniref:hypothetical protein n=1 Tax=Dongia sp. TaxID=1977262 RepID=UPI003751BA91